MIVRTPPPPKRPRADGDGQLVIYEDPPESSPSEHMLCTYQCRQMVKSDFIDALSKAENQARHYQSKFETLEPNFHKLESERKKFQDQFLYAQQELAAAKGREQALQDQLLMEVTQSQERLRKQIQLNTQLQVKLQNETDLRKKAESHAASAEEKATSFEGKLGHLSESIEREKKRLRDDHSQLKSDSKLSISRISAKLEQMECRANNAEREAELLKEQLKHLKDQLDKCLHQKIEVEKKLSTLMFQEVASTESNVLVKHLQQELRNYNMACDTFLTGLPITIADLEPHQIHSFYESLSNYCSFEGVLYCKPHFHQLFKMTGSWDKSFEGVPRSVRVERPAD